MKALFSYGFIGMAAVLLDQLLKYLVESRLPFQEAVPVLPFFALFRTYNTGMAFSMLAGFDDVALTIIAVAVIGFVIWLAFRSEPGQIFARLGFTLILGGAVGNLIDRTVYGHVVDYLLFHTQGWSFAVFNLADICITVGAALVVLEEFLSWFRQRSANH